MPTIKELENLINEDFSPDEISEKVPEKPIVNTFEDNLKGILGIVDIASIPGKEDYFPPFKNDDNIIYWKKSENDVGVEIIGIVWDENLSPKIICGAILPP